jgi:Flp pilus assembly CpaF family ATPase
MHHSKRRSICASNMDRNADLDDYDYLLRDAAADSRDRFLKMLGPIRQYLERDDVYNVNVNEGDEGSIFVETAGGKFKAPETMPRADREALIGNIAGKTNAAIDRLHAGLAADMPHGFDVRVQAFCPPKADWPIMLRPHASEVIGLSRQKVKFNPGRTRIKPPCPARGIDAIRASVARGEMIGIVGEPGSGKTTLMGGILEEAARIRPDARLVVVQDRHELKPSHRDCIQLFAEIEQKRYDGTPYEYTFEDALKDAVRTGFNILVLGELRSGPAAAAMVQAFNTGSRGGVGTWHASSALGGLYKLEYLLRIGGVPPIREMIVEAVDLLVYMYEKDIADIQRVMGVDAAGEYVLERVA